MVRLLGWAVFSVALACVPPASAMMDQMGMGQTAPGGGMTSTPEAAIPSAAGAPGGSGVQSGHPGMGMGMGSLGNPMPTPGADTMGTVRDPMPMGAGGAAARSRLPGFPGASHLYHIGATGFFLDHPQHLVLSADQQTRLNRIREQAALDRATAQRRIDEAEQELWTLTGADSPDASRIETVVRSIERLRGDQRLLHIRAVGEAAQVLTPAQQGGLLGTRPPAGAGGPPAGTPGMRKPAPMKPMREM
ncbi:MAG: periplasmic heavy metal sensor [Anaerolineae bacterium]|nr:periplasmic heavy metal sensor [Anaerolineae bacterium]